MKLLLTSGGLRNPTLTKTLLDLVGKPANELKVAFIPTSLNTEPGDKGWAIAQLVRLQQIGVGQVDIVDVSAIPSTTLTFLTRVTFRALKSFLPTRQPTVRRPLVYI
ncbi:MAG TPA: hypothetical protein VLH84_02055 [Patescibacteria group bacterium]|nr:hypothetical protein [Patescibacteria group bacterium]